LKYKNFNNQDIRIINNNDIIKEKKLIKLEIWENAPSLFAENNYVDVISLSASFFFLYTHIN